MLGEAHLPLLPGVGPAREHKKLASSLFCCTKHVAVILHLQKLQADYSTCLVCIGGPNIKNNVYISICSKVAETKSVAVVKPAAMLWWIFFPSFIAKRKYQTLFLMSILCNTWLTSSLSYCSASRLPPVLSLHVFFVWTWWRVFGTC